MRSKFIDITDRCTELEGIATEWQNRKDGTKGLTPLGGQKNSFTVGLKGELVYGRLVGLEDHLNLDYKPFGDGGHDGNEHEEPDRSRGTSTSPPAPPK